MYVGQYYYPHITDCRSCSVSHQGSSIQRFNLRKPLSDSQLSSTEITIHHNGSLVVISQAILDQDHSFIHSYNLLFHYRTQSGEHHNKNTNHNKMIIKAMGMNNSAKVNTHY